MEIIKTIDCPVKIFKVGKDGGGIDKSQKIIELKGVQPNDEFAKTGNL